MRNRRVRRDRFGVWAGVVVVCISVASCGNEAESLPVDGEENGDVRQPVEVRRVEAPPGVGSSQPHLSRYGTEILMSWLEPAEGEAYALRYSEFSAGAWSDPSLVTQGELLVNWADFPSVTRLSSDRLVAHWISLRDGYGAWVGWSEDGGSTWSSGEPLHTDRSSAEHGFVSLFPGSDGTAAAVWLDGRSGLDGREPDRGTGLFTRRLGAEWSAGDESVVDALTCECCQTDAVVTDRGPLVVYRDRTPDDLRDIAVSRLQDGEWTSPRAVHSDGWVIRGCPVNGPAASYRDGMLAVAWFTAPDDRPSVRVAFSEDEGDTFGNPISIDDRTPAGRVDIELLDASTALVTWIDRFEGEARLSGRLVDASGARSDMFELVGAEWDPDGYPQMVRGSDGSFLVAWTETGAESRVRVARVVLDPSQLLPAR